MPEVRLDKSSPVTLSRQIYLQMSHAIRQQHLGPDFRLPSTRTLARLLGVSRNTVLAAWDDLAADGLISGKRGAGTSVETDSRSRVPVHFKMKQVIRESGFPDRVLQMGDLDGNSLYIRY